MATTTHAKEEISEKVKQILVEELDVEEGEITPDSCIAEDLGADSLDQMDIVMTIEETFGIEVPDDDLGKLKTYPNVVDYIERKLRDK